jgi:hypothetical protein
MSIIGVGGVPNPFFFCGRGLIPDEYVHGLQEFARVAGPNVPRGHELHIIAREDEYEEIEVSADQGPITEDLLRGTSYPVHIDDTTTQLMRRVFENLKEKIEELGEKIGTFLEPGQNLYICFRLSAGNSNAAYWHRDDASPTGRALTMAVAEPFLHTKFVDDSANGCDTEIPADIDTAKTCDFQEPGSFSYFASTTCHSAPSSAMIGDRVRSSLVIQFEWSEKPNRMKELGALNEMFG